MPRDPIHFAEGYRQVGVRRGAGAGEDGVWSGTTTPADRRYAGYRYSAKVIATAVWLYFRFPLSQRMVEEMLAARGILVSHETVWLWGLKFGREIADRPRRWLPHDRSVPGVPRQTASSQTATGNDLTAPLKYLTLDAPNWLRSI